MSTWACSFVYLPLVMLQHSGYVVPIFILRISYVYPTCILRVSYVYPTWMVGKKYTKLVCFFFDIDVLIFYGTKIRCALLVAGDCASEVESSSVDVFAGTRVCTCSRVCRGARWRVMVKVMFVVLYTL